MAGEVSKWPYAATSTGRYLGYLKLQAHVFKSRVECWEAVGPARDEFNDIIGPNLAACIKDNSHSLLDSECLINFSLFMIGRSAQRTKPSIMFVSEDKSARMEALRIVRESGMLADNPGFETGHCSRIAEFSQLRQFGGPDHDMDMSDPKDQECSVSIYSREGRVSEGTLLYTSSGAGDFSEPRALATAGGILSFGGQFFILTVAHPLYRRTAKDKTSIAWDFDHDNTEDADDGCEISGLESSDDDAEDELMVDATSRGSFTPDVGSDREDPAYGSTWSSASQEEQIGREYSSAEPFGDESCAGKNGITDDSENAGPNPLKRIGNVVEISSELDYALVRLDTSNLDHNALLLSSHRLDRPSTWNMGVEARQVPVTLRRRDNQSVKGNLFQNRPFTLLPGTKNFLQLYTAEFEEQIVPGDCGSPVRASEGGALFGQVVAGSKTSKLVLIIPAHFCFDDIVASFALRLANLELTPQSEATAVGDNWNLNIAHASAATVNHLPSIDSTPEHKNLQDSKPSPQVDLPKGQCRYILLIPEIKGQRCACNRFSPTESLSATCDCGHLACFHQRSQYDPSVYNELNELKSKLAQLEEAVRTESRGDDTLMTRLNEMEKEIQKSREEGEEQIKGVYRNINLSWRSIESLERNVQSSEERQRRAVGQLNSGEEEMSIVQSESTGRRRPELDTSTEKWLGHGEISDIAMGDGEAESSHGFRDPCIVHITLLPHPHMPIPFERNTNAYQRCLSRGLMQVVVVGGTHAEDFTTAVEKTFVSILRGRPWAPMQTELCTLEKLQRLPMLRPLASNVEQKPYDAEFLRKHCAVYDNCGRMSVYITMKRHILSWHFLRHLPVFVEGLEGSWEYDPLLDTPPFSGSHDDTDRPVARAITPPLVASRKRRVQGETETSGSGSGSESCTHDRKKLNMRGAEVELTRRTGAAK